MKKGFTLIELLVVILIIGILAAIALPQYKKSKEKAEAVELQIMVKALQESQQRYYIVYNSFAKKFDDLDMDYSGYERGGCEVFSDFGKTDCFSNEKNGLFIHVSKASFSLRKKGKYKRSGFMYNNSNDTHLPPNTLLCYEFKNHGFCSNVLNCDLIYEEDSTNSYYTCKF